MKKRQLAILFVSGIIIASIVFAVMSGNNGSARPTGKGAVAKNLKYVKVEEVFNDTVDVIISELGRVTSSRNVNLTAEVQGKLEEGSMPLKSGQRFNRGSFLFKIDDTEQKLALQSRKSQFLNLVASILPDLKIDYNENFKNWEAFFNELDALKPIPELPETKSVNEKTFLASRNILSEFYGIKADEARLRKYRVIAPFDGSYTSVMVEIGTVVNTGTQIAKIIQTGSLEISLSVNLNELRLLKIGMPVTIFSEDQSSNWKGKIVRIGQNVNQATQSVDVFIEIEGGEKELLYEGMFVQAEIKAGDVMDAFEIPRKALFEENKVYVINDSLLEVQEVSVRKINEKTAVVTGLKDGSKFVPEPLIGVKEGMKVIPIINE